MIGSYPVPNGSSLLLEKDQHDGLDDEPDTSLNTWHFLRSVDGQLFAVCLISVAVLVLVAEEIN